MFQNIKKWQRGCLFVLMCLLSAFVLVGFDDAAGAPKKFSVVGSDGKAVVYTSSKSTVGKALRELDIPYKRNRVYPAVGQTLQEGMSIYIVNNSEKLHVADTVCAAPVEYFEDRRLDYGLEKIEQKGKDGKARVISKVVTAADGSEQLVELGREITVKPHRHVIRKGMAMAVKTPNGIKRYKKKMVVEATAYWTHDPVDASGTGLAYDGTPAVPYKTIAVDPKVIPLQSRVYIPNIGQVRANDTGSAIKGAIIDIAMDSRDAAWKWGRRNIEIYILEE